MKIVRAHNDWVRSRQAILLASAGDAFQWPPKSSGQNILINQRIETMAEAMCVQQVAFIQGPLALKVHKNHSMVVVYYRLLVL